MKEKCNTKVVFHYLSAPCASDFQQNLAAIPALALESHGTEQLEKSELFLKALSHIVFYKLISPMAD